MTKDYVAVPNDLTAGQTMAFLRTAMKPLKRVYYIYVTDLENHLAGMTSLRRLIIADPNKKVADFMGKRSFKVTVDAPIKDVGQIISKYNVLALPVVDKDNHLLGIVTIDDVLEKTLPDHWKREKIMHRAPKKNGGANGHSHAPEVVVP